METLILGLTYLTHIILVASLLSLLLGMIQKFPSISYANSKATNFLVYTITTLFVLVLLYFLAILIKYILLMQVSIGF